MKLNATVALTLILLVLMIGAGLVSATWGAAIGREALKGITQPDTRPANNTASRQAGAPRHEDLAVLPEDKIIASVETRMNGTAKDANAAPAPKTAAPAAAKQQQFPLVSQNQNVVLEIASAQKQGDALVLRVNLRNNGNQPVRFLYSFLTVTAPQGRTLNATTEGLPAELPAASQAFSGTVSIPTSGLDGVDKLSLSLTDYPDQRLQLQVPNIPVAK